MNDLISRQAVRLIESDPDAYPQEWNDDYEKGFTDALNKVLDLPSAQPKTGKWIKDNSLYKCSSCKDLCTVAGWANCIPEEQMYKSFKFCPNCGARMEG